MHIIGRGNQHQIACRVCQQFLQAFVHMKPFLRRALPSFFPDIPDTGNLQILNGLNLVIMPTCHAPKAYNGYFVFHFLSSPCYAQYMAPLSS